MSDRLLAVSRGFSVVLFLIVAACTSVPANSPILNQRVTDGIEKLKQQHFVSLDEIERQSISQINDDYDEIFSSAKKIFTEKEGRPPGSDADYMKVSIIATGIRDKIVLYIRNNIAQIKKEVEKHYDLVTNINNEVTEYLYSASRLSTARTKVTELISEITGVNLDLEKKLLDLDKKITEIKGEINQ